MYKFYIHNLLLPIAPESFQLRYKTGNKTINLLNGEEINIPTHPGLSEISFKCLIPRRRYPFAVYEKDVFLPIEWFTRTLMVLLYGQQPVLFVIKKVPQFYAKDLRMRVTLEKYEVLDEATNGDDLMVSLVLKEYVDYGTKSVEISTDGSEAYAVVTNDRPVFTEQEKTHVVEYGESLFSIARRYLGDVSRYKEIYELNKEVLEETAAKNNMESSMRGRWIYTGTVLKIP